MASFSGGDGSSMEAAIVIEGVDDTFEGIAAEYEWLEQMHGEQCTCWDLVSQAVHLSEGQRFDRLEIALRNGHKECIFFDVTSFFGK